jgi:hypothetical protein
MIGGIVVGVACIITWKAAWEHWSIAAAHYEAAERGENMAANLQAAVANYLACA